MFHNLTPGMLQRMRELETIDARDRVDGTPHHQRLRQIPPETGKFLALLTASAPPGSILEIGASAGYSTMWLALACRAAGRRLTTFELLPEKAALARATFRQADVEPLITLVEGDARTYLPDYDPIAVCFLDTEKSIYSECYELVVPRLAPGGWLLADNAINHRHALEEFIQRAETDPRVDALVVPVGSGVLVCRKAA